MTIVTTVDEHARPLSEFMAIVHDLRNPLSTIHGSAELLLSSTLSDFQLRRLAQNVYDASARMNELLEECLIRCRKAEETAKSYDVMELVKTAMDEVRVRAHLQSVQISASVPEELMIVVDGLRVRRVLVNLFV